MKELYNVLAKKAVNGMDFVISKRLLSTQSVNERIIKSEISTMKEKITGIKVYITWTGYEDDIKRDFEAKLENNVNLEKLLVLGNFIGQTRTRRQHYQQVLGPHGYGIHKEKRNLLDFFVRNNITVKNSWNKTRQPQETAVMEKLKYLLTI